LTTYLFSLGLVPVQDWIEKARRSRDLRAGSVWLCQVMAKVLSHLRDGQGAEILLPRESSEDPGASFSAIAKGSFADALKLRYGIPNRASGYFEAAADEQVREVFGALQREVVQVAWDALKRQHLNAELPLVAGLWRKLWQLPSFREVWEAGDDSPVTLIWAAAPAERARSSRREDLAAAERLFAAAKRTRPVRPWRFGSAAGKCNQCGQREAVGPAERFADWLDWQEKLAGDPGVAAGRRLDPGERLCHVCLARRMAGYAARAEFPSTGLIAMAPWLARARRDRVLSRLLADLEQAPRTDTDLAWSLTASRQALTEAGAAIALRIRDQIRERIGALRKAGERGDGAAAPAEPPLAPEPPSYLAVLAFDGDSMGRHVREHFELVPDGLASFARRARDLIVKASGEPFYVAGDEGLALAPAATALALALAIRGAFDAVFGELGLPHLTLSLGLAFFEHSRPLAGALQACRAALDQAKSLPGKNALAVAIETASGSRWSVAAPWGEVWEGMASAVALVRDRRLAGGWAHDVEALLGSLPRGIWRQPDVEPVREEVRRLFSRRFKATGRTAAVRRRQRDDAWASLQAGSWWRGEGPPGELPPRAEQFRLLAFLARQAGQAPPGDGGAQP
jgi:hypothetical protein